MSNGKWFHRGKDARRLNQPRSLRDNRVSIESRADFYNGWDEQDRLMRPAPTAVERAESESVRQRLREFAKTL